MNTLLRILGLERGTDVSHVNSWDWTFATEWSSEIIYTVLIIGIVLALINFLPRISMRISTRIWTFVLRIAITALILAMLCGLTLHVSLNVNKNQNWLVLVDDSASMDTPDSQGTTRFNSAKADSEEIGNEINSNIKLQVKTLSGIDLGESSSKGPTPLEETIRKNVLSRVEYDRLIVLTDGRDSDGRDLSKLGEDLKSKGVGVSVKVYGEEVAALDSAIQAIAENSMIRLGDELNIRGELTGNVLNGIQQITLKENGKVVKNFTVDGSKGGQFFTSYKPEAKGRHTYSVELKNDDGISQNNISIFTADVVEDKIDILLVEGYPRYEFKLLKTVLEVEPIVNLVSICQIPGGGIYVQGDPLHKNAEQGLLISQADLFKYDIVIMRDISRNYFREGGDTSESSLQNIVNFVTKRGGGLIVSGGQDMYRAGSYENSHLAPILPFDLSTKFTKKPQFPGKFFVNITKAAYAHPVLKLLPDDTANRERLNNLPELDGSNNVGSFRPLATPLLTRFIDLEIKLGKIETVEVPIMGYQAVGDGKVLANSVDTLWRWQLQPEFDDPPLTMLMANAVRYLAPPPTLDVGSPGIDLPSYNPQVGKNLELSTYLKDKNYDPITQANLKVLVTKPDGNEQMIYPRDLPEEPGLYRYSIFCDQPGSYTVKTISGKLSESRSFLVGNAFGEYANLSSDKQGMTILTKSADGEIIDSVNEWLEIVDQQPASLVTERNLEVWSSPLMMILFIILISVDCYIRKRQGLV